MKKYILFKKYSELILPPHITYSNRKKLSITDMSYIRTSDPKMVATVIIKH